MNENEVEVSALCSGCDGEGRVPQPTAAVISGVPQTVVVARPCRWCKGSGRRALQPPV